MIEYLILLPVFIKRLIIIINDSVLIVFALIFSFSIRLGYWYFPEGNLLIACLGAPLIAVPIFIRFGLYRVVIRYISFSTIYSLVKAISLYAIIWGVVGFMSAIDGIPRSVILINWVLAILLVGGLRVLARVFFNNYYKDNIKKKRVLIYGAGEAGVQLMYELRHSEIYTPVGFIDRNEELQGRRIEDLNIYAEETIPYLINKLKVNGILIAIPSTSSETRLLIINKLEKYPVEIRILRSLDSLNNGKVTIDDLHEVNVSDLLGRDASVPNQKLMAKNISNKVVMVTGAGGSIGSELCRQIMLLNPKILILYEISEFALYKVEMELNEKFLVNKVSIYPILGNVNNALRLSSTLKHFKVATIFHAAAYKHVPLVELNVTEGVSNNIFGTLCCAQEAITAKVENFVLISSDKAVRPSNVMGATKRSAELILQALSSEQKVTKFTMVRFGNVLGSSGSVIPLFQRQIKSGGPITVTDPNIIRYFMTITEAVELVIQACSMTNGGDVFVLDMGKPIRIYDLAKKMVNLSGLTIKDETNLSGDIEVKYTGLRPGEKLFEELLIGKNVDKTEVPLIMRAKEPMIEWRELELILDKIKESLAINDYIKIRELLIELVPEYSPKSTISDILAKKLTFK